MARTIKTNLCSKSEERNVNKLQYLGELRHHRDALYFARFKYRPEPYEEHTIRFFTFVIERETEKCFFTKTGRFLKNHLHPLAATPEGALDLAVQRARIHQKILMEQLENATNILRILDKRNVYQLTQLKAAEKQLKNYESVDDIPYEEWVEIMKDDVDPHILAMNYEFDNRTS